MKIQKKIEFIKESDKLKQIQRKTLNYHEQRYENSSEHSWHLALAVLVFSDQSNHKIDLLKCLKMALIHDIVEIDAGDQIIYAEDKNKFEKETLAAERIFGLLPETLCKEFKELWIEFEKKETQEAKYVGSLDRFLPLLSNVLNEGHSWKEHNITAAQVYAKNETAISSGSNAIWKESDSLLKSCIDKGILNHN